MSRVSGPNSGLGYTPRSYTGRLEVKAAESGVAGLPTQLGNPK